MCATEAISSIVLRVFVVYVSFPALLDGMNNLVSVELF